MSCVLEVCDYHGPYPGNFVPSLLAVGRAVRERLGLDYRCAFPSAMSDRPWVDMVRAAGIAIDWLDTDQSRPSRLRSLLAVARGAEVALIRSHFTTWDLEAGVVGRHLGVPVVWNIHTSLGDDVARQRRSDLVKVRALGRLCSRVIAVSEAVELESLARGFPRQKVRRVLNGIDASRFRDAADPHVARARLGLPGDKQVVLAFGWQPRWKGVDVLALALADLQPGAVGLLVGGDDLRASLPDPLPPWLHVVEPTQQPGELYAAADVFVSASRREAFSYSIGEAMLMRLPVASSDIPGPSAYFAAPGVETYPVEDAGALRTTLEALLDPAERRARGEGNRAFVLSQLPLERHVDGVLSVFGELL